MLGIRRWHPNAHVGAFAKVLLWRIYRARSFGVIRIYCIRHSYILTEFGYIFAGGEQR